MTYFTLQRPESRGSVRIASADPRAAPLIDLNYFAVEDDLATMRAGVRMCRDILAQPAFDRLKGPEYAPGADATSDAQIDRFLRRETFSNFHLSGTCRMGQDGDAVVDSRLRVRGLSGLRVADASIMPAIVSGNINAPTIMIAEKAASLIATE
jgi:choline dehydrogenase